MLNELAPILTTKDVKAITGVAETSTLNKMVANKQFPKPLKRKSSHDPFRWKKSDVQKWLNENDDTITLKESELYTLIDQRIIKMLQNHPATR